MNYYPVFWPSGCIFQSSSEPEADTSPWRNLLVSGDVAQCHIVDGPTQLCTVLYSVLSLLDSSPFSIRSSYCWIVYRSLFGPLIAGQFTVLYSVLLLLVYRSLFGPLIAGQFTVLYSVLSLLLCSADWGFDNCVGPLQGKFLLRKNICFFKDQRQYKMCIFKRVSTLRYDHDQKMYLYNTTIGRIDKMFS